MRPLKYAVIPMVVVASLISGCQSKPHKNTQRYEVIEPAQSVSSEEAINFIRAQTELDRSRSGETSYDEGPNNHPAFVGEGGQSYTALTIREHETLLSVANRVMGMAQFTRLIYDLSDGVPSPDSVRAATQVSTLGGPTLFGEIAATYSDQIPGLQMFAASDGEGHALVVSDRGYARWSSLKIYDVQPGLLSESVRDLAQSIGWSQPQHLWMADDFRIHSEYPLVIELDNPRQAIASLLKRYPAQAQINPNTGIITVVPRLKP